MGEKWKTPKWMERYVEHIGNTGGWITPEYAMNCHGKDCNLDVNAPRALLCISVASQVAMLERLHAAGMLP